MNNLKSIIRYKIIDKKPKCKYCLIENIKKSSNKLTRTRLKRVLKKECI